MQQTTRPQHVRTAIDINFRACAPQAHMISPSRYPHQGCMHGAATPSPCAWPLASRGLTVTDGDHVVLGIFGTPALSPPHATLRVAQLRSASGAGAAPFGAEENRAEHRARHRRPALGVVNAASPMHVHLPEARLGGCLWTWLRHTTRRDGSTLFGAELRPLCWPCHAQGTPLSPPATLPVPIGNARALEALGLSSTNTVMRKYCVNVTTFPPGCILAAVGGSVEGGEGLALARRTCDEQPGDPPPSALTLRAQYRHL